MSDIAQSRPIWSLLPSPLQKVYACFFVGGIVLRLPWWTLKYLIPAARPRKNISLSKCIQIRVLQTFFSFYDASGLVLSLTVHTPNAKALEVGNGVKGNLTEPLPESFVRGKLRAWARTANVSPKPCPVYWIHKNKADAESEHLPPSPDEKVILYFHGGAYILLSGHPSSPITKVAKNIMNAVPSVKRVLSLEYRLSAFPYLKVASEDRNPFPAALMDALQAYWYLVHDLGFKESQIVVVGDSAGGNLALAMTRYLIEQRDTEPTSPLFDTSKEMETNYKLPAPPGHLVLLSPWADLSGSFSFDPNGSHYTKRRTDCLSFPDCAISAPPSFIAPFGDPNVIARDVYISPASQYLSEDEASFAEFPRTFVCAGGDETLLDSIRKLRDRMKKALGEEDFMYIEAEGAVHDYLVVVPETQLESKLTLEAIKVFLDG